jgi:ABC-type uncharacterized transport system substrate-binding protein
MRRREFITILCGTVMGWPLVARAQEPPAPVVGFVKSAAQQTDRTHRIGILVAGGGKHDALARGRIAAVRAGLAERGWIEGRNIAIEIRYVAGQLDRIPVLVAELLRANVELIVTSGTQLTQAVQNASPTTALIMAGIGDPVGAGVVKSLSRPGGNTTGLSLIAPELAGKRLELAEEALGGLAHIAIIWNPENKSVRLRFKETAVAARKLGLALTSIQVRRSSDIATGLQAAARAGARALITTEDALLLANRKHVVDLALKLRLPAISGLRPFADAGALLSYGPSTFDLWHRTAGYVDKILSGARPADLPVERPTRFELVINLKTAKALDLKIPPKLIALADKVIE